MKNLTIYEIDEEVELPTSTVVEVAKVKKRKVKINTTKISFTNINSKLKKQLKKYDSHHLHKAIKIIQDTKLQHNKINKSFNNVPKLCNNCDHCIISLNHCSIFRKNCSTLAKKNFNSCTFLKPVN